MRVRVSGLGSYRVEGLEKEGAFGGVEVRASLWNLQSSYRARLGFNGCLRLVARCYKDLRLQETIRK